MIFSAISRRVFKLSKMTSQLNCFFVFSPVLLGNHNTLQNPSLISAKFRSFCISRLTQQSKISLTESYDPPSSLLASRVSRVARAEAQGVLFDYLYSTRSLSFTDAEHISKNSPHFLENLLSKINASEDLTRSLTRFLRFHPINEFEPFLESLGLSPSELSALIPQQLMFLSDDVIMLENYHVLCNYGIPRSKIGNIYKEAREIFGYDYGVLDSKLKAYENLGFSITTVIKLVSCCPSLLVGDVDRKFVEVIEKLRVLGFKNDWIGGYLSGKVELNSNRMFDILDLFEKVGYSEEQLHSLFKKSPPLLFEGSGKVYLLLGQLLKLGFKMNEVYFLFTQNPQILCGKYAKNLLKAVRFLVEIGMRVEDIAEIVSVHAELMCLCLLKGPKTVCRQLKVRRDGLCQIIKDDPVKFFHLASKRKIKISLQVAVHQDNSKQLEKTAFLLRLGYVENSEEMAKAFKKFRGRGDQLQERFDCLVEAGLDSNVVRRIIKHAPMVLNQSKDVIEKKIEYLRNFLGYPIESVVTFPSYFCYHMERINKRFAMYAWLRERGAAKPTLTLSTILTSSDAKFIKYYVDIHPEGPAMWESLKTSTSS